MFTKLVGGIAPDIQISKELVEADGNINDIDYSDMSNADLFTYQELFNFFQALADVDDELVENFTSEKNAEAHFTKHCMGTARRKSSRSSVFYDFSALDEYLAHESAISSAAEETKYQIADFIPLDYFYKVMREFFAGGKTVVLLSTCDLTNKHGRVEIVLHSWASDVTKNYRQNTVDFLVRTLDHDTITLYPLDANYLQTKLNSIISSSGIPDIELNYNR